MSEEQAASRLLPTHAVLDRIAISRTQLYRLINAGQFPKPLPVGQHRVAFLESEVSACRPWQSPREGARAALPNRQRLAGGEG